MESHTFELYPGEEYDKFCGKVFTTTTKRIIVHCTLCESKFFGFEHYINHITSEHLASETHEEEYLESECDDESMSTDQKEEIEISKIQMPQQAKEDIVNETTQRSSSKFAKILKKPSVGSKAKVVKHLPLPVLTEIEDRSRPAAIVTSEKGVFVCPHCSQRFALEWSLKAHLKEHDADRVYKCDICGAQFKLHRLLRVHLKRHEKHKPHKCTECERSFINQSELQYHMRNHTGEKPYQCEACGVRFAYKSSLKMHRKRQHTFEKDYVCPICNEGFYCARFLRNHMTKHTNEPSYECSKCGKKFNTSGCFERHLRQHRMMEEAKKERSQMTVEGTLALVDVLN